MDTVIFMDRYSSTPYYYTHSKYEVYFKFLNQLSLFLIPILYGLLTYEFFRVNMGKNIKFPVSLLLYILIVELLHLSGHEVKRITYLNRNYVTRKKSVPEGIQVDEC